MMTMELMSQVKSVIGLKHSAIYILDVVPVKEPAGTVVVSEVLTRQRYGGNLFKNQQHDKNYDCATARVSRDGAPALSIFLGLSLSY
jgi:hypothetical protein